MRKSRLSLVKPAVIKTTSGGTMVGIVHKEDADEVVLIDANGAQLPIRKSEIVSRQRGASAMPQNIAESLAKRDVRDLVEFLVNLKTPPPAASQPEQPETKR